MVALTLNGEARTLDVDPEMPLLWAIRDIIGLTGTEIRLRPGTVRRMHRSYRRRPDAFMPDGGRRCRRRRHHHDRRAVGQGRQNGADRLGRIRRAAMRLLPVRPDHVGLGASDGNAEAHRPRHRLRDERQSVPLRNLSTHPRGDPRSRPPTGGMTMLPDRIERSPARPSAASFSSASRRPQDLSSATGWSRPIRQARKAPRRHRPTRSRHMSRSRRKTGS